MAAWIRLPLALRRMAAGAAATLALAAGPLQASVLYGTTVVGESPRSSDFGSADAFGFRTFDNFTVVGGGTVQRLTWSGLWLNQVQPAAAPAPDVLSWDIAFHDSSGGAPGAQLTLLNVLAGNVTSTYLGNGVLSAGGTYNVSVYEYSVDLLTPFDVSDGTEYWLSIMARSNNFAPIFAWRAGNGGDNSSYQQVLGAGGSVSNGGSVARDRHVLIEGTLAGEVPEPGSLLLALAALGALGYARTRRR